MLKKKIIALCFLIFLLSHAYAQYDGQSQFAAVKIDGVVHAVASDSWEVEGRGNHRAMVSVNNATELGVRVTLPWRRPDQFPQRKKVVILDRSTGREISGIWIKNISNESGQIAFQPPTVPGIYEIYYLPYHYRKDADDARYGKPWNDYLVPEYHANPGWVTKVSNQYNKLPVANALRFESRLPFDFFTSMGLIATANETHRFDEAKGDFVLFPEDRAFPVRLTNCLPVRWAGRTPVNFFEGFAQRNEYYTFQLGLYAHKRGLKNVRIEFSDLLGKNGRIISRDSLTCFNQEGINWDGNPIKFGVDVAKNKVRSLWVGLSVSNGTLPGTYEGWAIVSAADAKTQRVRLRIHVGSTQLTERGDGELWRHSRLRWLNSRLGIENGPIPPFGPPSRDEKTIRLSNGKEVRLSEFGLPLQITNHGSGIFKASPELTLKTASGYVSLTPSPIKFKDTAGKISWNNYWTGASLKIECHGSVDFDGSIIYSFTLDAPGNIRLENLGLKLSFQEKDVPYFMGIGLQGGAMPGLPYTWNWAGPWDSFWIGNTDAGIHFEFEKSSYNGPLLNDYKPDPPVVWANHGKGTVTVKRNHGDEIVVLAETGVQEIRVGQPVSFGFKILITPVKEVDTKKHFSERYYQGDPLKIETAAADGANVINIHHNTSLNPYINYPFVVRDTLSAYIRQQHASGRKVKLYYTIRELSNHATEIYALKSLGSEIFPDGEGAGTPWLWEHLDGGYKAAWYAPSENGTSDASIVMNGFSRWINYYIEGLRWMIQHDQIDGLYLDDVAYDKDVIERLRRVLLRYNPEALLDLHSNNNYSVGPANQYTAFFPYLDRLWFGESFKYNKMTPDQWLVQFSGIPFGQMSEMLQNDGNQWLGMLYGTTNRHSWGARSPAAIWKYWDKVNIKAAKMYGYWDNNCPVRSNNEQVKITTYQLPDKLLLSIGNFSDTVQYVTPMLHEKFMSQSLGAIKITAQSIKDFQEHAVFEYGKAIRIEPKKGLLLEVTKKED